MQQVLVTGANGFIGSALCDHLISCGYSVRGIVREIRSTTAVEYFKCDLALPKNVMAICDGVDCIVHLAGRAHITTERESNPLNVFRRINCEATLQLAETAIAAGVRRFVFVSSIGVNGSEIMTAPFNEISQESPDADYARSKFEAELGLKAMFAKTKAELVIVRPPIVYGGGAPGNFLRLMRLVALGMPLPFGSIVNRRSMVAVENLVDFISCCIEHPAAVDQLFLVSDGTDISTPEIVQRLADGMRRKAILFRVPPSVAKLTLALVGKETTFTQLWGSLVIDSSKARNLLGWRPKVQTDKALVHAGKVFSMKR